jgi:hypothetical protein
MFPTDATGEDLAGMLVKAMLRNNYWIARHRDCVNIAYIGDINPDGSLNDNHSPGAPRQLGGNGSAKSLVDAEADGSTRHVSQAGTVQSLDSGAGIIR